MVIRVFRTNFVSKFILFRAPILLEDASVNSLLCNNITLAMRYSLRNIGSANTVSMLTSAERNLVPSECIVLQVKLKSPGIGWIAHTMNSMLS